MNTHRVSLLTPAVFFALLDAAGIKDADTARRLGVSDATVARWRNGKRRMTDAHYEALANLAVSFGTLWLSLHHLQGKGLVEQPATGTAIRIDRMPTDYYGSLAHAFRAQLDGLLGLAQGDPATWDCATLRGAVQELDGMARALEIIQQDRYKRDQNDAEIQ